MIINIIIPVLLHDLPYNMLYNMYGYLSLLIFFLLSIMSEDLKDLVCNKQLSIADSVMRRLF